MTRSRYCGSKIFVYVSKRWELSLHIRLSPWSDPQFLIVDKGHWRDEQWALEQQFDVILKLCHDLLCYGYGICWGAMAGVIHICYGVTQTTIPQPPYAQCTHIPTYPIPQQLSQHIKIAHSLQKLLFLLILQCSFETRSSDMVDVAPSRYSQLLKA